MTARTLRRSLAGFAAATALLGVSAAPAGAFAGGTRLDLYFPTVTVAADSAGRVASPVLSAEQPGNAEDSVLIRGLKITVDFAAAADVATVTRAPADPDDEPALAGSLACTTAGTVLTCTSNRPQVIEQFGSWDFLNLVVKPVAGAVAGRTGTLAFTARADGVAPVSYRSTVRIGEGVDLATTPRLQASSRPGGQLEVRPTVTNAGTRRIDGAVLVYLPVSGLQPARRFSNCRYGEVVSCTFTEAIEVGATYALAQPLSLAVPPDAAAPTRADDLGAWLTPTDFADGVEELTDIDLGRPGSGGPLTLVRQGERGAAAVPQTDLTEDNSYFAVQLSITGRNAVDVAAVGSTIRGAKGAKVATKVGLRNLGPATLAGNLFTGDHTFAHVSVPRGTTVVRVDDRCLPADDSEDLVGARRYVCLSDRRLTAGKAALFDFTFRLDADITDGAGTVRVNDRAVGPVVALDSDKRNDVAKILVNPTGGGAGGGLPVTGAGTGLIAGAGGLLLLAGAVGLLLTRRRRTHFTA